MRGVLCAEVLLVNGEHQAEREVVVDAASGRCSVRARILAPTADTRKLWRTTCAPKWLRSARQVNVCPTRVR